MKLQQILNRSTLKKAVAVCLATALVVGSFFFVSGTIHNEDKKQVQKAFESRVEKVHSELDRETTRYQNLLATLGAFFNASENVTETEFSNFVDGLGIANSYPGINSLAYAQKFDGNEGSEIITQATDSGIEFDVDLQTSHGTYAPILYASNNFVLFATGTDAYSIPGVKDSFDLSQSTSKVAAGAPETYVKGDDKQKGYIISFPVSGGAPLQTEPTNGDKQTGWVLAHINPAAFLTAATSLKELDIQIVDKLTGKYLVEPTSKLSSTYTDKFTYGIGSRVREATLSASDEFISESYDHTKALRYAMLVVSIEIIALLLLLVLYMHKMRRRREVNLTFQAAHDTLTGLPNRFYLEKWLKERVTSTKRLQMVAVLFIDLDGFKAINDTLGHQMGDEFLIAISQRLQKEVRERDVLARLGGDEFIVVLDDVNDEAQATRIAQRLIEVVRFPVMLDSGPVCVGASIGIAITTLDIHSDYTSVIRFADAAMYAAKEDKNERIRVFDHKLKSIVDGRHEVESSIRGASSRSEIIDVLQPLVKVAEGTTFGYEALCRWSHPVFGILSPNQFLDAAKVTGEIIEIDRWMVNKAFQSAIDISNDSNVDTRVWVNLSVRHLLQGEFYQYVMRALRNSDTTADMLGVEIEEEVFKIDNGLLYPFLNQLRDLGIAIALDDFGSEDASLQALKRYQYDVIKLDRSLITEFSINPSASIVPAVVELARSQNMTVVATGVETPEQLQKVIDVGCDVVQGYVFSAPKPLEELVDREPGFKWQLPLGVSNRVSRSQVSGVKISEEPEQPALEA